MSSEWPLCPEARAAAFGRHEIQVAARVVPCLRLVEARAWRSEYGRRLLEGQGTIAAYACRNRRPYPETPVTWARHSEHAHGTAVDVNAASNPFRSDGVLTSDFARFGLEDGRDWLAAWLEPPPGLPVLFRWGGTWGTDLELAVVALRHEGERVRSGTVDPMHFELALSPAEVEGYDWGRAIREEEEMNKRLEEAAEFVERLRDRLKPGKDEATVKGAAERTAEAVRWVEERKGG